MSTYHKTDMVDPSPWRYQNFHPPFKEIITMSRIVWNERRGIISVDWRSPMISVRSNAREREFVPHAILDNDRLTAMVAGRVGR